MNTTPIEKRAMFQTSADAILLSKILLKAEIGDVIKYVDLNAAVPGRDVQSDSNGILQTAIRMARNEKSVVFGTVRGVGIKRLNDEEIVRLHTDANQRVRHLARRTARKIACADYDKLTPSGKVQFNLGLTMFRTIEAITSGSSQKKIEAAVIEKTKAMSWKDTIKLFEK